MEPAAAEEQKEPDNPLMRKKKTPEELAKEAEEFVQKLKEKQEQDINQILNATVSSTTPLPSPNSTLIKDVTVSLEQPASPINEKQQPPPQSPINRKVDAAINLPTPPERTETSPVKSNQNDNKKTTTDVPTISNKAKEGSEKKKTKPKCGCVIS